MKRRMFKKIAALASLAVSVAACPLCVSAAGVEDVFDASYYADSYADLKAAFGYDETALLQHYMTYGLNEGRTGSTVFDAAAYRSAYPDLDAAFGNNWNAYVDHYYTFGITEGRTAGVLGEDAAVVPTDNTTANQQTPAPSAPAASSAVNGVYCQEGSPVNVTITFSDVETWNNESESYQLPPQGCEWQRFTVTVTTDGTPIDPYVLETYITLALSPDEVTYRDWVDAQRMFCFDVNYNGVTYTDCEAYLYCYESDKSPTKVSVEFEALVPIGYRLPAIVYLDEDMGVRY